MVETELGWVVESVPHQLFGCFVNAEVGVRWRGYFSGAAVSYRIDLLGECTSPIQLRGVRGSLPGGRAASA